MVGGYAARMHGATRPTRDVDVALSNDPRELRVVGRCLTRTRRPHPHRRRPRGAAIQRIGGVLGKAAAAESADPARRPTAGGCGRGVRRSPMPGCRPGRARRGSGMAAEGRPARPRRGRPRYSLVTCLLRRSSAMINQRENVSPGSPQGLSAVRTGRRNPWRWRCRPLPSRTARRSRHDPHAGADTRRTPPCS